MALRFIVNPTEERSANKVVVRWWDENRGYGYEYEINGQDVSGTMSRREALDELVKNLCAYGYDAELEHGYYQKIWVSYG